MFLKNNRFQLFGGLVMTALLGLAGAFLLIHEQTFLSYLSFVCAQVLFYEISVKRALNSFWFLGLFYFLVFSCVQGLVILCRIFSVPFLIWPLVFVVNLLFLGNELKRVPHFPPRCHSRGSGNPDPRFRGGDISLNFYLFSSLWPSFVWAGLLSQQTFFAARHSLEALVWSWFSAVLFPILAGIKGRIELMDLPPHFFSAGIFLVAAGFLLLAVSFF